jgi:hypothetical protein
VTWACPQCDQEFKKKECFSDGKYCAMKHGDSKYIKGTDILLEDMREICVHKQEKAK